MPQPPTDQGDENDIHAPVLTADRPYRPTDVYECFQRTGHHHVRTLDGRVYCIACGATGYARLS